MWTEQFQAFLNIMLMVAMLRLSYDLGRPRAVGSNPGTGAGPDRASAGLSPQQAEWAEKAVKRYAEAQEKKWRMWSEVMFKAG